MAKYSNEVVYNIKTNLDASGITKLRNELNSLQQKIHSMEGNNLFGQSLGPNQVKRYSDAINDLDKAIVKCFNPSTGMLNLQKFNKYLMSSSNTLTTLNQAFKITGAQGVASFNSIVASITKLTPAATKANSLLNKMATTMGNTVRWGITASIFQEMMSSISGAVNYVKQLDESLTQIQMVSQQSAQSMRELAQYANKAAQSLSTTTVDYTNAIKVFTQEGFALPEAKLQAELSVKLANVSEQDTATTADQITAYRNAFGLSIDEMAQSLDKLANVANNTAANVGELMTAAQRSASVASAVGATEDTFIASVATIQSVTRQSAEEIGNGLKTIMQRFADIKVDGKTDDGVAYGEYAKALQQVGVDVLDASGQFKGFDQIIRELQDVWGNLSDTMKVAVGEKVAGKFQYNRFAALMNNQEYFDKAYNSTQNADGMMDTMQDTYAQSIEGRMKTLQAAGEQLISSLFDQDSVEPVLETVTNLVNGLDKIVEVAGGGIPVFTALSAILLKTFSSQISSNLISMAQSLSTTMNSAKNVQSMSSTLSSLGLAGQGLNSNTYAQATTGAYLIDGASSANQQQFSESIQKLAMAENEAKLSAEQLNETHKKMSTSIFGGVDYTIALAEAEEKLAQAQAGAANTAKILEEAEEKLAQAKRRGEQTAVAEQAVLDKQSASNNAKQVAEAEEKRVESLRIIHEHLVGTAEAAKSELDTVKDLAITDERRAGIEQKIDNIIKQHIDELKMAGVATAEIKEYEQQAAAAKKDYVNAQQQAWEAAEKEKQTTAELVALNSQMAKEKIGNSFTSALSGAMSLVFAGQMLSSMFKTLSDDSASFEDKINSVFIGGLMGITMLVSGITGVSNAFKSAAGASLIAAAANRVHEEGLEGDAAKAAIDAAANEGRALTFKQSAKMVAADTAALLSNIAAAGGRAIASGLLNFAILLETLGFTKLSEAIRKVTIAMAANPIGAFIAAIAAATLVIIGVVAAINSAINYYNRFDNAIKEANENLKQASEAAKNAAEAYNELYNAITSISNNDNLFDGLTKGTVEWSNALMQANQEVIDLLDKYPELANYIKIGENGQMTIDKNDENVQAILQKSQQQAAATMSAKISATERVNTATQTKKAVGLASSDKFETTYEDYNMGTSTTISAWTGSKFNSDEARAEVITQVGKALAADPSLYENQDKFNKMLSDLGVTSEKLQQAFWDTRSSIMTFGNSVDAQSKAIEAQRDAAAATALSGNKEYANSSSTAQQLARQMYVENTSVGSDAYEAAKKKAINEDKYLSSNGSVTDAGKSRYAELAGYAYQDGKFYKKDENGNADTEAEIKVDASTISEALISAGIDTSTVVSDANAKLSGLNESQLGLVDSYLNNKDLFVNENGEQLYSSIDEFIAAIKAGGEDFTGAMSQVASNMLSQKQKEMSDSQITASNNLMSAMSEKGLTAEQQVQILGSLDKDSTVEEINAAIDAINDGADIKDVAATLSPSSDKTLLSDREDWGRDSEEVSQYADNLQDLAEAGEGVAKSLEHDREAAVKIADANARMNKGIKTLSENMEDWSDALDSPGTQEYATAVKGIGSAVEDLLDLDAGTFKDTLGDEFIAENLSDIEAAANGDVDAIQRLRIAAADQIIVNANIDMDTFGDEVNALTAAIANTNFEDLEIGASLDSTPVFDALNELVDGCALTVEQANAMLEGLGFEPQIEYMDVPASETANDDGTYTYTYEGPDGETKTIRVDHQLTQNTNGTVSIPFFSGSKTKFQGAPSKSVNPSNKKSSGGGGGGGGSSKKKRTDEADKNERDPFIEIKNAIERQTAALEEQEELDNELYGVDKINNLNKMIDSHKELAKLYQQEADIQKQQIEMQRNQDADEYGNLTVKGLAGKVGMTVEYNEDGDIVNGKAIQDALYARYKAAYDEETAHSDEDDYSEYTENTKYWKDLYDKWVSGEGEYGDMLDNLDDINKTIREQIDAMQDLNDSIVDTAHDMLEKWIDVSKEQHDFIQKIAEFRNGADLSKLLEPSIQNATNTIGDILNWSGYFDDDEKNEISMSNSEFESNKAAIDAVNKQMALNTKNGLSEYYADEDDNYDTMYEAFKAATPDANGNYDWAKAESVFAEGNISGIRDAMVKGDKDAAQKIYDEVYRSITQNSSRTTEQKQNDLNQFNEYVNSISKSVDDINKQNEQLVANSDLQYKALTGSSQWQTALTAIQSRYDEAKDAFNKKDNDGDFTQTDSYENLQDALQTGQSLVEQLLDAVSQLEDSIADGIDKMGDLIDKQMAKYDRAMDKLSSYGSINDLIYGNSQAGYENKIALADVSIDALSGKIQSAQVGIDAYQEVVDSYSKIAAANGMTLEQLKTSNIISQAEVDAIQTAEDGISDLQQQQIDNETELLEKIAERLDAQANQAANDLANQLLGTDADWLQQEWEMQTRNEELYLDDMNRAYNIQKLQYSYQQMLNDSANANSLIQQKISAAMEDQLEYLRNKEDLSQTDIDYANARLAILEKEIALEDAQMNKTQMKLQRDASGNYSYIYTANEDDVAKKQQDLLDAQINAYNIAKEGLLAAEEDTISQIASARDQIVSIWTDTSLDVEERQRRIEEVMQYLGEYTEARSDQIKTYSLETLQSIATSEGKISEENAGNLTSIYETMEESLDDALGKVDTRFATFQESTGQTIGDIGTDIRGLGGTMSAVASGVYTSYTDTLDRFKEFIGNSNTEDSFLGKVHSSLETAKNDAEESAKAIGLSFTGDNKKNVDDFADAIQNIGDEIDALNGLNTDDLQDNLGELGEQIRDATEELHGKDGAGGLKGAVNEAIAAFKNMYTKVTGWLEEINKKASDVTISVGAVGEAAVSVDTNQNVPEENPQQQQQQQQQETWHYDYVGTIQNGEGPYAVASRGLGDGSRWRELYFNDGESVVDYLNRVGYMYTGQKLYTRSWYDTGGYTGTWNDGMQNAKNGKLAVLHQKELVLNANDTENLLDIVKQVRQMQNINLSQTFDLSKIGSQSNRDTIEQRVEITAEFPSVTSSQEIETALLNLADMAYQNAHRDY